MVAGVAVGAFGLLCLAFALRSVGKVASARRRAALFERAAVVRVVEAPAAEGLVAVRGEATPTAPLSASPGGEDCLYYQVQLHRWRPRRKSGGGRSGDWRMVDGEHRATGFWLEDASGRALVDAEWARWSLDRPLEVIGDGADLESYPEPARAYLEEHGVKARGGRIRGQQIRLRARHVSPGQTLWVYGRATADGPREQVSDGYRGTTRPTPAFRREGIEVVSDLPPEEAASRERHLAGGALLSAWITGILGAVLTAAGAITALALA